MDETIRVLAWVRSNWFPITRDHRGELQVGHAGIWVGPCYYSLWPTGDISMSRPFTEIPGVFSMSQEQDEEVLGGPPTHVYTFRNLCIKTVREQLAVTLGNTKYALWNRNCSTFVLDLLLRGYKNARACDPSFWSLWERYELLTYYGMMTTPAVKKVGCCIPLAVSQICARIVRVCCEQQNQQQVPQIPHTGCGS